MDTHTLLLSEILLSPSLSTGLSPVQWDLLVRQARRANLLARLALALERLPIPEPVRPHLDAALLLARRQREQALREVTLIRQALSTCEGPLVLLKGAAYLTAGLDVALGRMFSDVDILVPHAQILSVEKALMLHGWDYGEIDDYDSRYYRQWMHELPPMQHRRRGSAIDVHHTILPPTARTQIDTQALFEHLIELPELPGVYVLPPTDMLLHSATHLFHEGEFEHGLRDLFDLDSLLRQFGADPHFWTGLLARAKRIGLQRQLHHALRYARLLLSTPVPETVLTELDQLPGATPPALTQVALDYGFRRALRPRHASCALPGTDLALTALYIRSHWQRMPPHLLARHLARKLVNHWKPDPPPTPV